MSGGSAPKAWEPGGPSPNPGGKKPLPPWLKAKDGELLQLMCDAALKGRIPLAPAGEGDDPEVTDDGEPVEPSKTQVVPPKERLRAAEALLNRLRGRPPLADDDDGDDANRVLARLYRKVRNPAAP